MKERTKLLLIAAVFAGTKAFGQTPIIADGVPVFKSTILNLADETMAIYEIR